MSETEASEIRSNLAERLYEDALSAAAALNDEGADDVYGVAIIANSGFFSGVGMVSNTESHRIATTREVNDPTLGPEYFELSVDEWDRYDWASFATTNDYLAGLEDPYYAGELPVTEDDAFGELVISTVVEVLRRLDLRRRLQSRHATDLYVGLGFSDASEKQASSVVAVGEALNSQRWIDSLRTLYGEA